MKTYSKAVLIFNPGSGKGKAPERAADFKEKWESKFMMPVRLRPTKSFSDIRTASSEAEKDELKVFMGGDGTLSECLQGIWEKADYKKLEEPVAFLPGGTGNSFLRDFNITNYEEGRDSLFAAFESRDILPIDMAEIHYEHNENRAPVNRLFINIFGLGIISDTVATAIKLRFLGDLNYTIGVLKNAFTTKPIQAHVEIDGIKKEIQGKALSLNNSRFTGGNMEIAPSVRVDDGKLFMMYSEENSPIGMINLFPSIMKGKHLENPKIECRFVEKLKFQKETPFLMNVDGELERGYNPSIQIKSKNWNLFIPKGSFPK